MNQEFQPCIYITVTSPPASGMVKGMRLVQRALDEVEHFSSKDTDIYPTFQVDNTIIGSIINAMSLGGKTSAIIG